MSHNNDCATARNSLFHMARMQLRRVCPLALDARGKARPDPPKHTAASKYSRIGTYPQYRKKSEKCYTDYMANSKPALPVPLSPEQVESQEFKLESLSLQKECEARFDAATLTALKKITYYITAVGFSIEEACTLSNVDPEKFKFLMETEPLIQKVIRIKELEYKRGLMHTVSARAKDGDDKLAQWLLERRFPEEFGGKKGGGGTERDILFEAIEFIQKSGDRNPLIKETSGRAIRVSTSSTLTSKKPEGLKEKIMAIKEILV